MPNVSSCPGVTGQFTKEGRPVGYSTLTPFLALEDPSGAIDFYERVFGAKTVSVVEMPVGSRKAVVHAELDFGNGRLQLGVPNPAYGLIPPPLQGQACYSIALYTADVDATVRRAVESGATVREPAGNFVSGDRFASLLDPFGVRWTVMTRIEDLSDEESRARIDAWAQQAQQ